jgi:phospholipid transport system substrate-binding protein
MTTSLSLTRRSFVLAATATAAAYVAGMAPALALQTDPAAQKVSSLYGALLGAMKQARQLGARGRYEKLRPVVETTFDVQRMSKVACGAAWNGLQPGQQAAVADAFLNMMTAEYANRFDDFTGERFEVGAVADQPPADKIVKTTLVQSNGKAVSLNYLMSKSADGWRIADVYLDGTISQLAARRAEFASILKSGGADALVSALSGKVSKLLSAR